MKKRYAETCTHIHHCGTMLTPLSSANNAPAMSILEWLAADKESATGARSESEKPAIRKSLKDQRQDCAQVSNLATMGTGLRQGAVKAVLICSFMDR